MLRDHVHTGVTLSPKCISDRWSQLNNLSGLISESIDTFPTRPKTHIHASRSCPHRSISVPKMYIRQMEPTEQSIRLDIGVHRYLSYEAEDSYSCFEIMSTPEYLCPQNVYPTDGAN